MQGVEQNCEHGVQQDQTPSGDQNGRTLLPQNQPSIERTPARGDASLALRRLPWSISVMLYVGLYTPWQGHVGTVTEAVTEAVSTIAKVVAHNTSI